MEPSEYGKQLIKLLDTAVLNFQNSLENIQDQVADNIEQMMSTLDTDKNGLIKPTSENFKKLASIKSQLLKVLDKTDYGNQSTKYLAAYTSFTNLTDVYFTAVANKYTVSKAMEVIKQTAIETTVQNLSKTGLISATASTMTSPVINGIINNITRGAPYLSAVKQMRQVVTGGESDGPLQRYAKPLAIDSLNRFAANYTNAAAIGLGMDWFMYVGPVIRTTRCWCKCVLKIKYIHRSEFQQLLDMDFPGFDCDVYDKTGLAQGLIEGTTPDNLTENRGGYNCNHQFSPIPDNFVPAFERARIT